MKLKLLQTVVLSRTLHIFYQHCHNLTFGISFEGDHELFNDFYSKVSEDYDRLAEYSIAQIGNIEFDTSVIHEMIFQELTTLKVEQMSVSDMFTNSLKLEEKFYLALTELSKELLIGLQNMVGDIAEQSDIRVYKIKQRLK